MENIAVSYPESLSNDPILEALIEVRFEKSGQLVEITLASFLSHWPELIPSRVADAVPEQLMDMHPALKYKTGYELVDANIPNFILRLGGQSISIHATRPYMSWKKYFPLIEKTVNTLNKIILPLKITRIGLRYINVFEAEMHHVNSLNDLSVNLSINEHENSDKFNAIYTKKINDNASINVRVATPNFIEGEIPPMTVALLDIDVYSPDHHIFNGADDALMWIQSAHDYEKMAFFESVKTHVITKWNEDVSNSA